MVPASLRLSLEPAKQVTGAQMSVCCGDRTDSLQAQPFYAQAHSISTTKAACELYDCTR